MSTLSPINDHEHFCLKGFNDIIDGQGFAPENILKMKEQCIGTRGKGHVQIECTKELKVSSSLGAQNACGQDVNYDGTCPLGFSMVVQNRRYLNFLHAASFLVKHFACGAIFGQIFCLRRYF